MHNSIQIERYNARFHFTSKNEWKNFDLILFFIMSWKWDIIKKDQIFSLSLYICYLFNVVVVAGCCCCCCCCYCESYLYFICHCCSRSRVKILCVLLIWIYWLAVYGFHLSRFTNNAVYRHPYDTHQRTSTSTTCVLYMNMIHI